MDDSVEENLIEQVRLDEILADWRKAWRDNDGIYKEGVPMPPPLYDEDVRTWVENKNQSIELQKVDKERLKKFYNAELLLKAIELKEESDRRYKEVMERWMSMKKEIMD